MNLSEIVRHSKLATHAVSALTLKQKNLLLKDFAEGIEKSRAELLRANAEDLAEAKKNLLSQSMYQRLVLSNEKITQLVRGVQDVILLPDPCNQILSSRSLADKLQLTKISTPIGLIAVIFESRPDVIPQVLSLMIKSGNACLLKGGKEALNTNRAFMKIIEELRAQHNFWPEQAVTFLETREQIHEILAFHNEIDLVIPRGSNALIQNIMANTKIPVMGHADGVCHIFVDDVFDFVKALDIIVDAKTQYPSACNSLETLLVHKNVATDFLPKLAQKLNQCSVDLLGCDQTIKIIGECSPVRDWHTEYGDLHLAIKVVNDIHDAIKHIELYGSHHTDAIISKNKEHIDTFKSQVDSASVMVNISTRFSDGFRYGLGAEVGISTNKTHARGPVGLEGLVIYKYIVEGDGHTVANYTGPE
ncbi:MAG: glutamate-5-semialdehyde dehydrogenase [Bdellovibrionales bacterium]|nr:glutamate-5-semialdehyde dehydrogenase [Bdellovibrionales bacterium]